MKPKRRVLLSLVAVLLLTMVVLPAAAQARPTFDQAIDQLYADEYPQGLEAYFTSLGTNPDLGFRWAGTSAERAVSARVLKEYRAMGLVGPRLERVPCDVFEFKSASLSFNNRTVVASTFGGVPGTPPQGITGKVVYVGGGTADDYEGVGDVSGKLVLVDKMMSSWWFNMPAFEATLRGAAGMIVTASSEDPKYYSIADDALGSFDGYYDTHAVPLIYISKTDGDALKAFIVSAGPNAEANLKLDVNVKMADDGGFGYNVVGVIQGRSNDGQMVVMDAHQDAHFRAGMDDTAALVNMITVAKAMKMSGYRPQHTIVFLATMGEEFAYSNAYYEWCIGAWYAATHTHKAWTGKIRAVLSIELMALKDAPLTLDTTPELKPFLEGITADNGDLLPNGSEIVMPINSWNDQWTWTAAGAPSVELSTSSEYYDTLYHTNYETSALVDWDYLADIAKMMQRIQAGLDTGLLPYSIQARAEDLLAAVDTAAIAEAGVDEIHVVRLAQAIEGFVDAADWVEANRAALAGKSAVANATLLAAVKDLNHGLTALSPWDASIYPHQQALSDVQALNTALAAITPPAKDTQAALDALGGTYLTWYGINFGYTTFLWELTRRAPGYYRITWGGQGQLPGPLDVMPEYRTIQAGMYIGALTGLTMKRDANCDGLSLRITRMSSVLERATARINTLR
jgi:Iap family predicted aminopeptidase